MKRAHNFSAGPSALPISALERARGELLDFEGSGMSIMEMSHRGKIYDAVHEEALALVRELMSVPEDYDILFLQGGATLQFAQVPMNLCRADQSADYVITDVWGQKAYKEAKHLGQARVAADTVVDGKFYRVPTRDELELDPAAAYLHFTTNNTIMGTQFHSFPDPAAVPLVADMSSDIMGRPVDVSKFGLIYAGAQKNLGPSGITLVIVRRDLVLSGRTDIPFILQYRTQQQARSLANTVPTFGVYMLRNVLTWLRELGGVPVIYARNQKKAEQLYTALQERPDMYRLSVEPSSRSFMNVVWNLATDEDEAKCVAAATAAGLIGLKGHKLVGGMRASIYNAVPPEAVDALCDFLRGYGR